MQLEAAKADRVAVQGDISFRNTRIEEVCPCLLLTPGLLALTSASGIDVHLNTPCKQPQWRLLHLWANMQHILHSCTFLLNPNLCNSLLYCMLACSRLRHHGEQLQHSWKHSPRRMMVSLGNSERLLTEQAWLSKRPSR